MTTLYEDGGLAFYEACSLETIRNAVKKFKLLGLVKTMKVRVKKNQYSTYYEVTDEFKDGVKIGELSKQLSVFPPQS